MFLITIYIISLIRKKNFTTVLLVSATFNINMRIKKGDLQHFNSLSLHITNILFKIFILFYSIIT